jgi:hypothetical protein
MIANTKFARKSEECGVDAIVGGSGSRGMMGLKKPPP